MAHDKVRIPNKLLRPLIEDYLAKQEDGELTSRWGTQQTTNPPARVKNLCFMLGLPDRRLWEIRNKDGNTNFSTADKILVGLGKEHLWYEDPELNEYYEKVA